jgi:hypothetical protein
VFRSVIEPGGRRWMNQATRSMTTLFTNSPKPT